VQEKETGKRTRAGRGGGGGVHLRYKGTSGWKTLRAESKESFAENCSDHRGGEVGSNKKNSRKGKKLEGEGRNQQMPPKQFLAPLELQIWARMNRWVIHLQGGPALAKIASGMFAWTRQEGILEQTCQGAGNWRKRSFKPDGGQMKAERMGRYLKRQCRERKPCSSQP